MYCYRHPNRETGVSCSECGRGICPDCMVFAPVGIRCPEHAGKAQGPSRVTQGVRRVSYEGQGALVTKILIGINVLVFLINLAQGSSLTQVSGSLFVKGALYVPGGARPGRVVSPDHGGVPAREPDPPRDEHARSLVHRRAGRAGDRARAVPRDLHRVGARRLGGRDHLQPERRSRSARRARSSGSSARRSSSRRRRTTCSAVRRSA